MIERLEATVHGRVQMVMYRDFAQRKGSALSLRGEVWNESDGTVRVTAEGPRPALERYLAKLHTGPLLARVDRVESEWYPAQGAFTTFRIRYE